jgi:hypothetical protein
MTIVAVWGESGVARLDVECDHCRELIVPGADGVCVIPYPLGESGPVEIYHYHGGSGCSGPGMVRHLTGSPEFGGIVQPMVSHIWALKKLTRARKPTWGWPIEPDGRVARPEDPVDGSTRPPGAVRSEEQARLEEPFAAIRRARWRSEDLGP